jgi:asparagine synthase (glutamine-hydrolysing)
MDSAPLCCGKPRFGDAALATQHAEQGALPAWRAALADGTRLDAALASVQGDFAIGLRLGDGRDLLAVDRFAQRSLCYRLRDGRLEWAERADELGGEIDPQALFDYLYFHNIPSPRTVFKGVLRLPPGHYALLENGSLKVAPYWQPKFSEPTASDFEALKQEFLRLTRDAVARQLDGSPPACFLSGGTDSSTVAGMLAQLAPGQVAGYSIGFDAQGYDEMAYARLAAKRYGVRHHEYYVTPQDLVRSIPEVAASFDQPFGNSSALPAFYCAKMAREQGVSRLLAGDGGDELFGGNARYAKQRVFARYQQVPALLRSGLLEPLLASPLGGLSKITRKGRSYVEQAKLPMPDRLRLYNLVMRLGPADVLTPRLLQQLDLDAPLRLQQQVWKATPACAELNRELAYDWRFTLAESDLPKVCGATRLAGVSVGFPLLDEALLDFSLRLPVDYKLRGDQLRWFFKEALRGFLPDEIISKKKHGFGLPFGVWTGRTPALMALAQDSLRGLAARGVVREDFVRQLLDTRLAEHPGYYGEMVWILMTLEQWLRAKAPDFRVG